jgi:hypothetical protein
VQHDDDLVAFHGVHVVGQVQFLLEDVQQAILSLLMLSMVEV